MTETSDTVKDVPSVFDPDSCCFRADDQPITWDNVTFAVEIAIAEAGNQLSDMTHEFLETPEANATSFSEAAEGVFLDLCRRAALLGRGAMTPEDMLDAVPLMEEVPLPSSVTTHFSRFADDFRRGDVERGEHLPGIVASFTPLARRCYEESRRTLFLAGGAVAERRVTPEDGCCPECDALANLGWQAVGSLPPICSCGCQTACRCTFAFDGITEEPDDSEALFADDDVDSQQAATEFLQSSLADTAGDVGAAWMHLERMADLRDRGILANESVRECGKMLRRCYTLEQLQDLSGRRNLTFAAEDRKTHLISGLLAEFNVMADDTPPSRDELVLSCGRTQFAAATQLADLGLGDYAAELVMEAIGLADVPENRDIIANDIPFRADPDSEMILVDGSPFFASAVIEFLRGEGASEEEILDAIAEYPAVCSASAAFAIAEDSLELLVNGLPLAIENKDGVLTFSQGHPDVLERLRRDPGLLAVFYSPDQPRGEKGSHDGGQFVPKSGGSSAASAPATPDKPKLGKRMLDAAKEHGLGILKKIPIVGEAAKAIGDIKARSAAREWGKRGKADANETKEEKKSRIADQEKGLKARYERHKQFVASYAKKLEDKISRGEGGLRDRIKLAVVKMDRRGKKMAAAIKEKVTGKKEGDEEPSGKRGWGATLWRWGKQLASTQAQLGEHWERRLAVKYGGPGGKGLGGKVIKGLVRATNLAITAAGIGAVLTGGTMLGVAGAALTGGISATAIGAVTAGALGSAAYWTAGHAGRKFMACLAVDAIASPTRAIGRAIGRGDVKAIAKGVGNVAKAGGQLAVQGTKWAGQQVKEVATGPGKNLLKATGRVAGKAVAAADRALKSSGSIHDLVRSGARKLGIDDASRKEHGESVRARRDRGERLFSADEQHDATGIPDGFDMNGLMREVSEHAAENIKRISKWMMDHKDEIDKLDKALKEAGVNADDLDEPLQTMASGIGRTMSAPGKEAADKAVAAKAKAALADAKKAISGHKKTSAFDNASDTASPVEFALATCSEDASAAWRETEIHAMHRAATRRCREVSPLLDDLSDAFRTVATSLVGTAVANLQASFGAEQTRELLAAGMLVPEAATAMTAPLLAWARFYADLSSPRRGKKESLSEFSDDGRAATNERLSVSGVIEIGSRVLNRLLDAWQGFSDDLLDPEIDALIGYAHE